jgi:chromosome segregation ATPase
MGVMRSIGRWFKALGYLLTGRLDSARQALDTNPHAIKARFDEIIRDKVSRIQEYKKAVASLVAQQEKKIAQVKSLTDEVGRLENLKTGAAAKAKQVVESLKAAGRTTEEIQANEDYKKCLAAFNDFSSTLAEKQSHIEELESGVREYQTSIGNHKVQLQQLLRDVDGLRAEAAETVADIITAKEEKEITDMVSGISEDGSSEELQQMRDLRQKVKAEGRISRELSGMDTRVQETEFLEYARSSESSSEFDRLIGLGEEADQAPAAAAKETPAADTKLPE